MFGVDGDVIEALKLDRLKRPWKLEFGTEVAHDVKFPEILHPLVTQWVSALQENSFALDRSEYPEEALPPWQSEKTLPTMPSSG